MLKFHLPCSWYQDHIPSSGVGLVRFDSSADSNQFSVPRKTRPTHALVMEKRAMKGKELILLDEQAKSLSLEERAIVLATSFLIDCK